MSDIQYLAIKEFNGKRADKDVSITKTGPQTDSVVIAQTATPGHDLYGVSVHIVYFNETGLNATIENFKIRQNGVTIKEIDNPSSESGQITYDFDSIKVAAGQDIDVVVSQSGGTLNTRYIAEMIMWEEDTNATPQIPPLKPI